MPRSVGVAWRAARARAKGEMASSPGLAELLSTLTLSDVASASVDGATLLAASKPTGGGDCAVSGGASAVVDPCFPRWMRVSEGGEPYSSAGVALLTRDDTLLFVEHAKQRRQTPIHIEMLGGGIERAEAALGSTCDMLVSAAAREFSEELRGALLLDVSALAMAHASGCVVEYVYPPEPPARLFPIRSASFLIRTELSSEEVGAAFAATHGKRLSRESNEVRGCFFLPLTLDLLHVRELDPPIVDTAAGQFFIKSRARRVLESLLLCAHSKSMSPRDLFYDCRVSVPLPKGSATGIAHSGLHGGGSGGGGSARSGGGRESTGWDRGGGGGEGTVQTRKLGKGVIREGIGAATWRK